MKLTYSLSDRSRNGDYHVEKYLCPFCPTNSGVPAELTIAFERSTYRIAWTECTNGYANCCSIAELHAKLPITDSGCQ